MRKSCLIPILCVVFSIACECVWSAPPIGVKILPESVDWPLVRPAPYKSPKRDLRQEDIYELTFGVRRWLSGVEGPDGPNYQRRCSSRANGWNSTAVTACWGTERTSSREKGPGSDGRIVAVDLLSQRTAQEVFQLFPLSRIGHSPEILSRRPVRQDAHFRKTGQRVGDCD